MSTQSLEFKSGLDDSAFTAGLRRMEKGADKAARNIGTGFAKLGGVMKGALGVGALVAGTKVVLDFAGALQDQADVLGIGTERLQGFQGALSQSGVNAEKFTKGMVTLNEKLVEARNNTGSARTSFERLGIQLEDIDQDSPDEILLKIADGLKNAKDPANAFSAALDIIGSRQFKMVGALKQGREEFEKQAGAIKKLTAEQVAYIDRLGDTWDRAITSAQVYGGMAVAAFDGIPEGMFKSASVGSDSDKAIAMMNAANKLLGQSGPGVPLGFKFKRQGAEDPKVREAAERATKQALADKDALMKGDAEIQNIQREMYLDSLPAEQRLGELTRERIMLESQFIGSTALRQVEITKKVLSLDIERLKIVREIARAKQDEQDEIKKGLIAYDPNFQRAPDEMLPYDPAKSLGGMGRLTSGGLRSGGLATGGLSGVMDGTRTGGKKIQEKSDDPIPLLKRIANSLDGRGG